jgi:DNA-directed RNA polymerase subunit M/transcription elongation factor TFIIS
MAATITVVCPECSKTMHAPADFAGKKVRCKACGHIFRASPAPPAGAIARSAESKSAAAAKVTKSAPIAPVSDDDEDGDGNPYLVTSDTKNSRCPECANEMEGEDAIICLHCGYNTVTREKLAMRKVHEITSADRFLWLLPGFICGGIVLFLLLFDLLFCLLVQADRNSSWFVLLMAWSGTKMWVCIGSIFFMFFAGRFAYLRLILHPNPPEIEHH